MLTGNHITLFIPVTRFRRLEDGTSVEKDPAGFADYGFVIETGIWSTADLTRLHVSGKQHTFTGKSGKSKAKKHEEVGIRGNGIILWIQCNYREMRSCDDSLSSPIVLSLLEESRKTKEHEEMTRETAREGIILCTPGGQVKNII